MLFEGAHPGAGAGGADREGERSLHRMGIGRDDPPADDVGPFHRRRQGDADLVASPGGMLDRSGLHLPAVGAEDLDGSGRGLDGLTESEHDLQAEREATTAPLAGEVPSSWAWANAGAAKARTPPTATATPTPARARRPRLTRVATTGPTPATALPPAATSSGLIGGSERLVAAVPFCEYGDQRPRTWPASATTHQIAPPWRVPVKV